MAALWCSFPMEWLRSYPYLGERAAGGFGSDGPVAEGNVGGGTPMTGFDFKSGIGTASRVITFPVGVSYTVGVLVRANHGIREALTRWWTWRRSLG